VLQLSRRYKLACSLLFAASGVSFVIAGFLFYQYREMLSILHYYGISADIYLDNPQVAKTIQNFWMGIFKYLFVGFVSAVVGIIFLILGFRRHEKNN